MSSVSIVGAHGRHPMLLPQVNDSILAVKYLLRPDTTLPTPRPGKDARLRCATTHGVREPYRGSPDLW